MRTTRFHPYLDPVFKSPKYDWVAQALSLALTRTPGQHRRPCAEGVDVRFFQASLQASLQGDVGLSVRAGPHGEPSVRQVFHSANT